MRDIWAIASCMMSRIQHSWLLLILGIGIATQAALFFYSGPQEQDQILVTCRNFVLHASFFTTLLLVIVAGSTELPREVDSGTLLFVLGKPVRRYHIFAGKLLGLCLLGTAAVVLQVALGALVLLARGFNPGMTYLFESVFVVLRIGIIAAATVTCTVWFHEFPALFFCGLYVAIGMHMSLVDYFIRFFPAPLSYRLPLRTAYYMFPNFSHLTVFAPGAVTPGAGLLSLGILYGCTYFLFLACVGAWGFQYREFSQL